MFAARAAPPVSSETRWSRNGVTARPRRGGGRLGRARVGARALLPLLNEGRTRGAIDRAFPVESRGGAHAYMLQARHFGKIVLTVD